jgi:serine-type D-Ala-D-Ala carboxypeptidase/endopeptidase (penicillin-binding protein 4)
MQRLIKTLSILLALTSPATAADLPGRVELALRKAGVPNSAVSILVQEIGASRPELALNVREPMNPASVMKLVTTYAALELLGPAYRWKTEVYRDGNNLAVKGYGDPKLNLESFWLMLRALRGRGLRDLPGDIVLDRSHFAPQPEIPFDDDTYRPYNVSPDALLVNFKSLRFGFLPVAESGTVQVFLEPPMPGLELVNGLRLVESSSCPEGRAFRERIQADFRPRPPRASFSGTYPAACGERELSVAR